MNVEENVKIDDDWEKLDAFLLSPEVDKIHQKDMQDTPVSL